MPTQHKVSQKVLRQAVNEAVYFHVRDDRRLLGIPPRARDQIVTYAVNEVMGYDRLVIDPTEMSDIDVNKEVIDSAIEAAITAGKFAHDTRLNSQ